MPLADHVVQRLRAQLLSAKGWYMAFFSSIQSGLQGMRAYAFLYVLIIPHRQSNTNRA